MHKAGVPVVAGTDGSGLELVRELEIYVEAGMTTSEALASATIVAARSVGVDKTTGSIDVGKAADLVLVDGDPSLRIGDLRYTQVVMMDGKLMDADALRAAAGFSGPPRKRLQMQAPPVTRSASSARSNIDFGNRQPKRFRGLQIDHEVELRRLFDGQIAGLGALDDSVDVAGGPPIEIRQIRSIGHEQARSGVFLERVNGGQTMLEGQIRDPLPLHEEQGPPNDHGADRLRAIAAKLLSSSSVVPTSTMIEFHIEPLGRGLEPMIAVRRSAGAPQRAKARERSP